MANGQMQMQIGTLSCASRRANKVSDKHYVNYGADVPGPLAAPAPHRAPMPEPEMRALERRLAPRADRYDYFKG